MQKIVLMRHFVTSSSQFAMLQNFRTARAESLAGSSPCLCRKSIWTRSFRLTKNSIAGCAKAHGTRLTRFWSACVRFAGAADARRVDRRVLPTDWPILS